MSNIELSKQEFEGQPLRAVIIDGEPWFAAPDVYRSLGLRTEALSQSLKGSLDPEEVQVIKPRDLVSQGNSLTDVRETFPKAPSITLIAESGLYKVILRAHRKDSPRAVRFQDFVTRDLLPNLRKGTLDTDLARKEMGESLAEAVGDKIEVIGTVETSRGIGVEKLRDGTLRCSHGQMKYIDTGKYARANGPYFRCTEKNSRGHWICGTVLDPEGSKIESVQIVTGSRELPTGFVLFGRPQDVAAAINQLKEEK